MAELTNKIIFIYGAGTRIFACRYYSGSPADPSVAFDAATNAWYELTETTTATTNSYYTENIPKGKYDLVEFDGAIYTTITPYTGLWHGTEDLKNHIVDAASDMRHDHTAINIATGDTGRLGNDLQDALDNITGITWDKDVDLSLKGHLDLATGAHASTAISHSIGAFTEVGSILDDHETRLDALETGTAVAPTNINDFSGEIGVDVEWDAQDVNGIEYYIRYLWKHSYELAPSFANLRHESRVASPFFNFNYGTRRFDIAINTDSDLVLYFAVGAKGRADASISWSAVQSTAVQIPNYRQESILQLSSLDLGNYVGSSSGSELLDRGEDFPTCSGETAEIPDDNFVTWKPIQDLTINKIQLVSGTSLSGNATMRYRSTSGGSTGSFVVNSSSKYGVTADIALDVDESDDLQIWSLDPKGIGHFTIQLKYTTR